MGVWCEDQIHTTGICLSTHVGTNPFGSAFLYKFVEIEHRLNESITQKGYGIVVRTQTPLGLTQVEADAGLLGGIRRLHTVIETKI
jgi:hypothetical protein